MKTKSLFASLILIFFVFGCKPNSSQLKVVHEKEYEAKPNTNISIISGVTSFDIKSYDGNTIKIKLILEGKKATKTKVNIENVDSNITIKVDSKDDIWDLFSNKHNRSYGEILIPKSCISKLEIKNGTGRINIAGIETKNLNIENGTGAIVISDAKSHANISSGTGSLTVSHSACSGSFETGTGSIKIDLDKVTDDISIESGTGSIRFNVTKDSQIDLQAETGTGSVNVNNLPNNYSKISENKQIRISTPDHKNSVKITSGTGSVNVGFK